MIGCRAGLLGSYLVANIGLFSVIFFFTFIKATFLGIFLALLMAVSTISWLKKMVPSPLTPKNYILLVICGAPKRITMLRNVSFIKIFYDILHRKQKRPVKFKANEVFPSEVHIS